MLIRPTSVISLLLALSAVPAYGRPPPGPPTDPAIAAWFHSLRRDSDNFPCCDASDCREVEEYREQDGSYYVFAKRDDFVMDKNDEQRWNSLFPGKDKVELMVPRGNVTIRTDNPTGSAILCYSVFQNIIYCFVPWDYKG